jgi:hypothetical protein
MSRALSVLFLVTSVACGGGGGATEPPRPPPVASAPAPKPPPAAPVLTAEERAACGPKKGAEIDSLACLVAEQKRADAGDAAGARALLAYGCDHDDVDACHDLRALEPSRAGEIDRKIAAACDALGDVGKKLAACLRGRTTEVLSSNEIAARLPVAFALDLRARYGPKLLAVQDAAQRACKQSVLTPTVASLAGTALDHDAAFTDVGVVCGDDAVVNNMAPSRDGEGVSTDYTVRTTHDSMLSDGKTMRVAAPTGHGRVGVYCPSLLVDGDDLADVWTSVETAGVTTLVIGTVRVAQSCRTPEGTASRAKEQAVLQKTLAPVEPAIADALDKLAKRCDERPAKLDRHKSPLAGSAIERTAGVLSFEPRCAYGFRSFTFASPKPLRHPGEMTSRHEFIRVGDQAMRVESIKQLPGRLEFTFRRRNAELVVGVKH